MIDLNKNEPRLMKIKTKELRAGMFVHDVGRNWLSHPWATKRKKIIAQTEIDQLLQHGIMEVVIDLERGDPAVVDSVQEHGITQRAVARSKKIDSVDLFHEVKDKGQDHKPENIQDVERRKKPRPDSAADTTSFDEELPMAQKTYQQALNVTREFMTDARLGKKIEVGKVQENVENMIDSVFRNRDAMLSLLKLKQYDEYTFTHCLNVAVLCLSMGRHMNLSRERMSRLGVGAIFHDVGKQLIPSEIINKPGKLTDEEFAVVQNHPVMGAELLAEDPNIHTLSLQVVRNHHERLDGTGYPDKIKGEQIKPAMAIGAVCDIYDALSSNRVYHKGMLPSEALKVVFSLRGKHLPNGFVDRFIQCLGIYPAGSTVRLKTGEIAVVTAVNKGFLLTPRVIIVMDAKKQPIKNPKTINLSNAGLVYRQVVKVIDPNDYGIEPAQYLEKVE